VMESQEGRTGSVGSTPQTNRRQESQTNMNTNRGNNERQPVNSDTAPVIAPTRCLKLCGKILRAIGDKEMCVACGRHLRNLGDALFIEQSTRHLIAFFEDMTENESLAVD